jgi:hypothetical protein
MTGDFPLSFLFTEFMKVNAEWIRYAQYKAAQKGIQRLLPNIKN